MLNIMLAVVQEFGTGTPVDDNLIIAIAEGDREALRELFSRISGNVYGFALAITKNRHDADDVLQETFLRVFSAAKSYRPQGKPMAWVLTLAKNAAQDKLRERKKTAELDSTDAELPDLSAIENLETRLIIRTLFEILSDEEKQIVILHAINGIKHREIAQVLDMPVGTLLSKYNRAIKKMTEYATKEQML